MCIGKLMRKSDGMLGGRGEGGSLVMVVIDWHPIQGGRVCTPNHFKHYKLG